MAKSKLELLLEVEGANQARRALDGVTGELDNMSRKQKDLSDTSRLAGRGLDMLGASAAGMIAAIGVREIAQFTAEMYNLGAASERAEIALNALTGGRADEYIKAIGDASLGTISKIDAMSAANRALKLGVVETAEQMAQLTQAAIVLGRAMGMDAATAMNDLVTGIGRASPLILDNLGITLKMSEIQDEVNRLMEENSELTEDNAQKIAIRNLALEQANALVEEMGGVTRDAASEVEYLAAEWDNLKTSIGEYLAEAGVPLIRALNHEIKSYKHAQESARDLHREIARGATSYQDFAAQVGRVNQQLSNEHRQHLSLKQAYATRAYYAELLREIEEEAEAHERRLIAAWAARAAQGHDTARATEEVAEATEDATKAAEEEVSEAEALAQAYVDGLITLEEYEAGKRELMTVTEQAAAKARDEAAALRELERAAKDAFDRQKALAGIGGELSDAQDDYRQTGDAAAYLTAQGEALLDLWRRSNNELELQGEAYDQLRLKYGLVTQEQLNMERGLNAIVEAMDRNILSTSTISRIYDDWVTGAIPNTEALNERIADSEERYRGVLTKLDETGLAAGTAAEESEAAADRMNQSFDSASTAAGNINWQLAHIETKLTRMTGQPWDIRLRISGSIPDIPSVVGAGGVEMRAAGGPVTAGRAYVVGEKGPELFVPDRSGTIVPQNALASSGGQTIVPIYIGDRLLDEIVIDGWVRGVRRRGGDVSAITRGAIQA